MVEIYQLDPGCYDLNFLLKFCNCNYETHFWFKFSKKGSKFEKMEATEVFYVALGKFKKPP